MNIATHGMSDASMIGVMLCEASMARTSIGICC